MSSEHLASAQNQLKGNLGGAWDMLSGAQGNYTDLGIARRFGGSAAAYSLRDIGAMNGRVVKVRRDLAGEEADPEEDFSASQVQSGSLEDWVNGKLENTLPADVATAAAAYSLRKVKASYASNAVRIRRSSDDAEVNVAFDSDNKVSTSSDISVVSGSTTATDLNGFLNPTYTVGTSVESASRTFNSFSANGNTGFTATKTGGGSSTGGFPYTFATGDVISVSFDLVIADSASPTFILSGNNMGSGSLGTGTTFTSSGSYTQELTTTSGTGTHLAFTDGNTGTFTVSNFQVTSHKAEAFVHTWYDQAGSNNAVQTTAANQPKIAENGALLADGLDFDGTNDRLVSSSGLSVTTSTDISFNLVGESDDITSTQTIISQKSGTGQGRSWTDIVSSNFRSSIGGSAKTFGAVSSNGTQFLFTYVLDESANTADAFRNAARSGSQQTVSNAEAADGEIVIGANNGESGQFLNGHLKELIIYTSDQSNNRFKIESNINNYYGLYNDENDSDSVFIGGSGSLYSPTVTNATKFGVRAVQTSEGSGWGAVGFLSNKPWAIDEKLFVSFNAVIADGTPSITVRADNTSTGNIVDENFVNFNDGFNSFEFTCDTASNTPFIAFQDSEAFDFTISDFRLSRIERNGFVPTWYDQSGNSNNAVQTTASDQPSIVLNGGLSSDGIEFNGSDDEMDLTSTLGATTVQSIFVVQKNDITSGGSMLFDNRDANDDGSALFATDSSGNKQASWDATDAEHTATTNEELIGLIKTSSAITIRVNGSQSASTSSTSTIDISTVPRIGQGSFGASGTNYNGSIKEIICFNADLLSDVSDIENNINNHYSIY